MVYERAASRIPACIGRYEHPVTPRDDEHQRLDRELGELLQELRVTLPGVQVLFAFLLTVPFSDRFERLSNADQRLFVGALAGAAVSSAFLIAPSAFHRLLFREGYKEWLVLIANRLAIVGMVFLAMSMTCALWLVADVIYGSTVASAVAGCAGATFITLWYVVPAVHRARKTD
jgi:hypothetical protein